MRRQRLDLGRPVAASPFWRLWLPGRWRSRVRTWLAFGLALWLAVLAAPPGGGVGAATAQASPRLVDIRATSSGLLLRLTGAAIPNLPVSVQRVLNPDRLAVDLPGVDVLSSLHNSQIPLNRYGVRQVRVAQFQKQPPLARVVLDLAETRGDWQAAFVSEGILLSPPPGPMTTTMPTTIPLSNPVPANEPSPVPLPLGTTPAPLEPIPVPTVTPTGNLPLFPQPSAVPSPPIASTGSLIQTILIDATGQILLRGDRPFAYRGAMDPVTNTYNLIVEGAAIAPNFVRPALPATSPIERIRLTAQNNAVAVAIRVAPGWNVQDLGNVDANQIALQVSGGDGRPPALPNVAQMPMPATRGRGVILIDPGHGGRDPGAVANNVREKDVVLSVGLRAGQMLQQMGYTVVYTRRDDREVELAPRVQLAEQVRADVFVSVHANAVDPRMSQVNGIETFHSPNSTAGRRLAELIQREAVAATGANDRRVKTARFYVVHRTSMPSVLLETGFVTNPQEARNLTNPTYQDRLAMAIARGVVAYLQQRD